jgi:hypothetical protein
MLPNNEDCLPGPIVCCDTLFSAGHTILHHALDAINNADCYLNECDAPNMDGIVSIGGASNYPHADLLTVSLQRMYPRETRIAQGRTPGATTFLSIWNVEFVETGWITFGEEGELPDPGMLEMLAMHSYSHAEQMFRRLRNAVTTGDIADGCKGGNCGASIGDLFPIEPRGHLVGWRTTVTVPIDFSKVCDGPTAG